MNLKLNSLGIWQLNLLMNTLQDTTLNTTELYIGSLNLKYLKNQTVV